MCAEEMHSIWSYINFSMDKGQDQYSKEILNENSMLPPYPKYNYIDGPSKPHQDKQRTNICIESKIYQLLSSEKRKHKKLKIFSSPSFHYLSKTHTSFSRYCEIYT